MMDKARPLTVPEGPRADDIRVLLTLFGVKRVWIEEWDTGAEFPKFIPSGKPWRTHSIDALTVPFYHELQSADFMVLHRVRTSWSYDGLIEFESALDHLQMIRQRDETANERKRRRFNWNSLLLRYQPGDFTRAALAAFNPEFMQSDAELDA